MSAQGVYTPCPHGFQAEVCPSCEPGQRTYEYGFRQSQRYAKALAVIEAARGLDKWQHICEGDLPDEDEAEAAFEALYSNWANLRAALAAFDEVEGS